MPFPCDFASLRPYFKAKLAFFHTFQKSIHLYILHLILYIELELRGLRRSGDRNDVANVLHTGHEEDQSLEA